jgi:tetratricopeptide (TPR) repeat protein
VKQVYTFVACLLFILISSCSTQKNTLISRTYHNITAKYNVFFNGNESYKKGIKKVEESSMDDYSRILPVFIYGNKEMATSIAPDMDVAIKKSSKLITLHSIKAKPSVKKGRKMTPQEKENYNRNEFNNWVDDAYLLVGKSHMYKQDYDNAENTFIFISREFPKEPSRYEAQLWLARVYSQTKDFSDAENIIGTLQTDKKFPKKYKRDLYTTVADLNLKQERYLPAIKSLESAIPLVHRKKFKLRYMFILAQLYQQTGQSEKASETYLQIIKKNPPYEMTFNARINLAGSIEAGSSNRLGIKKQLEKMLRDNKNSDFRDQIYYALGNIEMKEEHRAEAIEYYKKSVQYSTKNNDQKALSCLTLANLFYADKTYVSAQAYYDSTLLYIDPDYPGIADYKVKATKLNHLVENLNTINREDSLQRIAKLPEASRMKVIDNIISDLRTKEADAQLAESQRLQDYYANQSFQSAASSDKSAQAKWYFYNPASVTQGMKSFQLRWGKRKLEDNWRRRNKSLTTGEPAEVAGNENNTDKDKKKPLDNKSREYYLQNLPLTDSLMKASYKRAMEAYYNGGMVYRNDLNDIAQAISLYEKMIERFPENEFIQPVCYQLYSMYKETKNEAKAAYYRNLILTRYPESTFAKVMSDPNFYKQILEKEKEADRFYEQTYNLYNDGNYSQVIANAQSAGNQYPNNPILSKFALLKAMAVGKSSDKLAFRNELNQVIAKYPKDEVSNQAKDMLTYLNTYQPETKQQEDIKVAQATYLVEEKSTYYTVLVVDKQEDVNQLIFDLINFNLDHFSSDKLELNNEGLSKKFKAITIRTFPDRDKAMTYFKALSQKPEVLKNIKYSTKQLFVISLANYQILQKQESADSYLQFFKLHFQ